MATLYTEQKPQGFESYVAAAGVFKPSGGINNTSTVDVINDYSWTLTPKDGRVEVPYIELIEFEVNTTTISNQLQHYLNAAREPAVDPLSPYDKLFIKSSPTGFTYKLPFYTDINFEVTTPEWESLDTLEALQKGASDLAGLAFGGTVQNMVDQGFKIAGGAAGSYLATQYPKVAIMDRPKLWKSHNFRSYTVKFPLYNTVTVDEKTPEWVKNRELCELLINQNLYNKLSVITGIPPVFYEVLIPGQHFCPASCVTNITVYNRGNIRQFKRESKDYNVPDVYEVNITLTDMVIPSKNLFQAIDNYQERVSARVRSGQQLSPGCWVAREIYGTTNIKWVLFRDWLYGKTGPKWLQNVYTKYGERFAKWIKNKPFIKLTVKKLMDIVINKHYETK